MTWTLVLLWATLAASSLCAAELGIQSEADGADAERAREWIVKALKVEEELTGPQGAQTQWKDLRNDEKTSERGKRLYAQLDAKQREMAFYYKKATYLTMKAYHIVEDAGNNTLELPEGKIPDRRYKADRTVKWAPTVGRILDDEGERAKGAVSVYLGREDKVQLPFAVEELPDGAEAGTVAYGATVLFVERLNRDFGAMNRAGLKEAMSGSLAALLYHEKVHFQQAVTPGKWERTTTAAKEAEAYEAERIVLDKLLPSYNTRLRAYKDRLRSYVSQKAFENSILDAMDPAGKQLARLPLRPPAWDIPIAIEDVSREFDEVKNGIDSDILAESYAQGARQARTLQENMQADRRLREQKRELDMQRQYADLTTALSQDRALRKALKMAEERAKREKAEEYRRAVQSALEESQEAMAELAQSACKHPGTWTTEDFDRYVRAYSWLRDYGPDYGMGLPASATQGLKGCPKDFLDSLLEQGNFDLSWARSQSNSLSQKWNPTSTSHRKWSSDPSGESRRGGGINLPSLGQILSNLGYH